MMNVFPSKQLIPFQQCIRWLDSTFPKSHTSRHGQSCDVDCCGNPIIKNKDIIVEKDLEPCMYEKWRPRIPELSPEPKSKKSPSVKYVPKVCYAGMEPPPFPGDLIERGKECFARCKAKTVPKKPPPATGPQKNSSCPKKKALRAPKKLPFPDWDHDCTMDAY